MNNTTFLIWNGCDEYRIAQEGEVAYSRTASFSAFPVGPELNAEDVPRDEDGELNLAGMFVTDPSSLPKRFPWKLYNQSSSREAETCCRI